MTMTTALGDATVAELRSAVAGTVIVPGDDDYQSARRVWNYAIDRHPAMIIRCGGTADVVARRTLRTERRPAHRDTWWQTQHCGILDLR